MSLKLESSSSITSSSLSACCFEWKSLVSLRNIFALITVFLLYIVGDNTVQNIPLRQIHSTVSTQYSRHAFLLSGEIRTLRVCLSTQLELLNHPNGENIDIYAVLSPSTKHAHRPGEANASADDIELDWLRSLPSLKALQLVSVDHYESYIKEKLPGFPWTDTATLKRIYDWVPRPKNVVAAFLKRLIVYQLMEKTLRTSAEHLRTPIHHYDVVVVGRPDIFTPLTMNRIRWPDGIQLDDFSRDKWVGYDGKDYFPGQPDSWAPDEKGNGALLSRIFSPDAREGFFGDALSWGDMRATYHLCNAVLYIRQLLIEEKGGPKNESPVPVIDQGQLFFYGLIADVREETRKARLLDPHAVVQGIRIVHTPMVMCLGYTPQGERNCGDSAQWTQPFT
jgi:hypothetical protein